jgi:hypothetical protein
MSRAASLGQQFRARRGVFSDRISARGHRYEFSELDGLHGDMKTQILQMVQTLSVLEKSDHPDARKQINRLRGQLGNFRDMVRNELRFKTGDVFMSVARHLLPEDFFDAIFDQVRWLKTLEAKETINAIEGVFEAKRARP